MEFRRLQDFLDSLSGLPIADLGRKVEEQVSQLESEGKRRGWEVD